MLQFCAIKSSNCAEKINHKKKLRRKLRRSVFLKITQGVCPAQKSYFGMLPRMLSKMVEGSNRLKNQSAWYFILDPVTKIRA